METAFAEPLLAGDVSCPPGLVTWNGSDPARRFAVYRNNVVVGLVDALADSFPVTQELVGEEFFRAMAREFVRAAPPRSPVLALYGEGFAEFIEGFAPAAALPYLGDVARLEMQRVQSFHAADAPALTAAQLDACLADPAELPQARLRLHPSLFVLASAHAVVSLWAAHQSGSPELDLARLDPAQRETAMVCRRDMEVAIYRIEPGAASFIAALQRNAGFGAAIEAALANEPELDLPATLALLLRAGAIAGITTPRRTNP